ncbi:MAG TPA: cytochrome c3 family protein [Longimicrobiales bacterium]
MVAARLGRLFRTKLRALAWTDARLVRLFGTKLRPPAWTDARLGRLIRTMLLPAFCTVLATAIAGPLGAQDGFPHSAHEGLFPLCSGCHPAAGSTGTALYPSASLCANCHDGSELQAVRWTPPVEPRSAFQHAAHQRIALREGRSFECTDCHGSSGGGRMSIGPLNVGAACSGCHRVHEADGDCGLCHAPAASDHPLAVHAGCDRCHGEVRVDALPRTRTFCLLCHTELKAHAAPRSCTECHLAG